MALLTRRTLFRSMAVGVGGTALWSCAGGRGRSTPVTHPRAPRETTHGDRFAGLTGFCAGLRLLDPAEYAAHRERCRRLAESAGVGAVVVEAGVAMRYLSGVRWRPSERPMLYVLPTQGEPVWIGPAFEEGRLREQVGDAEVRVWQEHEPVSALVSSALRDRAVDAPVAIDPDMRSFVADRLRRAVGADAIVDGGSILCGARMRKTPAELALLRRANEATKRALQVVAGHVRVGMTEDDVRSLVSSAQLAAGLVDVWALVAFGPNAAYPHGTEDRRKLGESDFILIDTGGDLFGYQSDITRTWALGEISAAQTRAWETVRDAQKAALASIKPGARCGDVDEAARRVMARAGYGGNYERFTHRLGHGIGLQGHEHPYLVRGSETVIEPGMTMSNEPGIYIPGELGVRLEDIVAVTEDGAEVFGASPTTWSEP